MAVYTIWNNKGGVGKSYLTFQIASEYAQQNPDKNVLVIDMCPQANSSSMLLGGMLDGENHLQHIHSVLPRNTISGYIEARIVSPYVNPFRGADYLTNVHQFNNKVTDNLYLVVGDDNLELQAPQVLGATRPGPQDAWRSVHLWLRDLIVDIENRLIDKELTVFIDCNPSFSIYTTMSLAASERLIIPFSADGSSKRAVRSVLALVYGRNRNANQGVAPPNAQSEYYRNSMNYRMAIPSIYMYVGNRLTQINNGSASAFRHVVTEITEEIWSVWQSDPSVFKTHPNGANAPTNKRSFKNMFLFEIRDANTASVFSSATGTPMLKITAGARKNMNGKLVTINQSQLDMQGPNIQDLVSRIE